MSRTSTLVLHAVCWAAAVVGIFTATVAEASISGSPADQGRSAVVMVVCDAVALGCAYGAGRVIRKEVIR